MSLFGSGKYRFAGVEVDAERACVIRDGVELPLRPRPFRALLFLIEHPQRVVSKDELIEQVWEGTAVTDDALVKCIGEIRRALGDDSRNPSFVKTVSKGGYRFIAPLAERVPDDFAAVEVEEITTVEVEYEEDEPALTSAPAITARPAARQLALVVLLVAAVVSGVAVAVTLGRSADGGSLADMTLPLVEGRRPVAVMYFENQSADPELDWLREGLADMLITTLSSSKHLTVLSRGQLHLLLERAGHAEGTIIRLDEALDVARRSRADVVVMGSFASIEGRVRVDVRLHDVRDGRILASQFLVVESPDELLTRVDLLSRRLAANLGVSTRRDEPARPLTETMTSDLGAYRDYSLALERAQGFRNAEALDLLQRAVTADPEFAMAHARIGYVYCMTWPYPDKARPHLEEAFRRSGRVSEKDRLLIVVWYAVANRDYSGAIQSLRQIIADYPLEVEAYAALVKLLGGESRLEEAIEVARQGLAVDPEAGYLYNLLGGGYRDLGRRDEAIAAYRLYVDLEPEKPNPHDSLGLCYQWFGLYEEAIAEYERALALDPEFEISLVHLGNAYAQTGRSREAISCYVRYGEAAPSSVERARAQYSLAVQYFRNGDRTRARTAARKAIAESASSALTELEMALLDGNVAAAERASARLDDGYAGRGGRLTDRIRLAMLGRLAFAQGRPDEAIEQFREAIQRPAPFWQCDPLEDCLANGLLEAGRLDEALSEYERILGINPRYPLARYNLARLYERRNEPEKAADEYRRFLETWSLADEDSPEIVDARTRLATLDVRSTG